MPGPVLQRSRSPAGRVGRRLSLAALQHPLQHFPIPCKSGSNPATQRAHFSQHTARSTQAQAPTFSKAMVLPAGPCGIPSNLAWDFPSSAGYRAFGSMAEELNLCAGWSESAFPGQPAAAFVCPVARCAPRIYSSAIVDTALGMLAVDDCQALSRAARRRMRASLDYFYVRQLTSLNPPRYPKPIACCAVRERIYPGTPDSHLAGWSARLC
ncbi:uncharacterized protein K441DRAFT_694679 [Cenococcum geophilum 1.58]|uniref:uncharacterized protein n=1 Tax=Cenococcum geophilum 1.58 TaxID=794803 RepID=UPI00358FB1CA|nr:hypothetical protein K441DRAFT_694679 [Cenococcum geophilum 1.58]